MTHIYVPIPVQMQHLDLVETKTASSTYISATDGWDMGSNPEGDFEREKIKHKYAHPKTVYINSSIVPFLKKVYKNKPKRVACILP